MTRPTVFMTCAIPAAGLDLLRAECATRVWPDLLPPSQAALLARRHTRRSYRRPLLTLPTCIVVPQIANAGSATRNCMAELTARNLLARVRGERLPHGVNPSVFISPR